MEYLNDKTSVTLQQVSYESNDSGDFNCFRTRKSGSTGRLLEKFVYP